MVRILIIWLLFEAQVFARVDSRYQLEPHTYAGSRGLEPNQQLVIQSFQEWKSDFSDPHWKIGIHLEVEAFGSHDLSLDIDRAWYRLPMAKSTLTLGRIHPWELSNSPQADHPWGYLAQAHSQNMGLLLGSGYDGVFPRPLLTGWIGLHYWSSHTAPIQFGLSFSPFFIPGQGPRLSLSENQSSPVGRFGRRPPGYLKLEGEKVYPIEYELDKSNIIKDVVLQPQFMAQLHWKDNLLPGWISIAQFPGPQPTPETDGYLVVRKTGIEAHAVVRPLYHRRWVIDYTQKFLPKFMPLGMGLVGSLRVESNEEWGYELGIENNWAKVSYLHQVRDQNKNNQTLVVPQGKYADQLVQMEFQFLVDRFTFFSGLKKHLRQDDLWFRNGLRTKLSESMLLDMGADLFSGSDHTYFGEWRTNDRVYLTWTWRMN